MSDSLSNFREAQTKTEINSEAAKDKSLKQLRSSIIGENCAYHISEEFETLFKKIVKQPKQNNKTHQ